MEKKNILWKKRNRIRKVLSVIATSLLMSAPAFAEQEKSTPEVIYQSVLNNYTEVINASLNGVDVYELGKNYGLDYYWLNALPNGADVQYAFYDIDQNGIPEPFIQNSSDLFDAFGYDGNNIVRLFDTSGVGNRGKFTLYQNGIIETLSYGGQASVYEFYRMSANGFILEKIDQLYQSFDQYNRNGNKITGYEFQQIINAYESMPKAQLSWASLPKSNTPWKDAYIQFINEQEPLYNSLNGERIEAYKLVDINGDDIPELYICNGFTFAGDVVCTYANGSVQSEWLWIDGFSYLEGKNIFMDSGGHMDEFHDIVYSIVDGRITEIHRGEYGAEDVYQVQVNADGEPIYKYFWDGVEVTKDEYDFKKSNVYNGQEGFYPIADRDGMYTYAEIIEAIYNYPQ